MEVCGGSGMEVCGGGGVKACDGVEAAWSRGGVWRWWWECYASH